MPKAIVEQIAACIHLSSDRNFFQQPDEDQMEPLQIYGKRNCHYLSVPEAIATLSVGATRVVGISPYRAIICLIWEEGSRFLQFANTFVCHKMVADEKILPQERRNY